MGLLKSIVQGYAVGTVIRVGNNAMDKISSKHTAKKTAKKAAKDNKKAELERQKQIVKGGN